MKASEIRNQFTNFFFKKNHQLLPSSSLVPQNDPTLLFNNAGMNQFKDFFTGKANPEFKRVVTVQKCVRAGGKHNDLENVGHTARHHTFFEMLGNFSFGNYFKKEAILFAWEFLTEILKISPQKLYITVHHTDKEAFQIWTDSLGIAPERIFKKDQDNFWEMGEFGPCGPCSEIFYDHGPQYTDPNFKMAPGQDLLDDTSRYVEIWNLVFMQFEKRPNGTFPLPSPSIDTGAGLERIAAALQGCYWNYDTDLFQPIIKQIEKITGKKYEDPRYSAGMRVVADHIRSSTMLITDGVIPSNEGRGYVLRRIIRRAVRHLRELGPKEGSFHQLIPSVFATLSESYPGNAANAPLAHKFLEMEEKKFLETLDQGLKFLHDALKSNPQQKLFSGEMAFKLYDTFGFPLDLTESILKEKGILIDQKGFDDSMQIQKESSKKSWKGADFHKDKKVFYELVEKYGATKFTGYTTTLQPAKLLAVHPLNKENSDEGKKAPLGSLLIFDSSPFYGESGGQVGDQGEILVGDQVLAHIEDTQTPVEGLIVHYTPDSVSLKEQQTYTLRVNQKKRDLTARNHSATHLLQAALIKVLGQHVKQAGSLVNPEKLRFDFTHVGALSKEELQQVEFLVNEQVQKALPVKPEVMNKDEAFKKGAMALFNEKYGDKVRVVGMGEFSTEFCGGTHVHNTNEIQYFTIINESPLSSGVRRIEAVTSEMALNRLKERSALLENIERTLKVNEQEILPLIGNLKNQLQDLQRDNEALRDKIQSIESESLFTDPEVLKGNHLFKIAETAAGSDLKKFSDLFVNKFPNGILLLYSKSHDKISVLLRSHKSHQTLDCSKILAESLKILGGRGGGRKELAQGSGGNSEQLALFCQKTRELIIESL